MSPLAPQNADTIIEITAEALEQLKLLRDEEPEKERLGLRLEVFANPGEEFKYDLSFEIVTQAAFSDEVRTIDGLKIIIPLNSFEFINGATLDYELSASIEAVISTDVNPSLAAHGGFVTFVGHDTEGVAYLTMGGGCHGCSMSKMTMLDGVQTTLIEQVPGVLKVRDVTDHATGSNPYYK